MSSNIFHPLLPLENTYRTLPEKMYSPAMPVPVSSPVMLCFNSRLASDLGVDIAGRSDQELADLFSGRIIPEGAQPLAQAYAGHQFGHFTMLGDGRAILLGELVGEDGRRFDIQLKGAGQTAYSRRGDGRATLPAMLREYIISESMHHLGIPTSRSLAVVKTGEKVYRERIHDGAVLTRIAASHIRVGTFEYVRNYLSIEDLQAFTSYVIDRHYPDIRDAVNPAFALLQAVMHRQVELIVQWMRVGFIHGVMNTDNMSIAGETIDYGPCAFMNTYKPGTVFSSIDEQGRYAFANQPAIAQWNLSVLAGALLPLLATEEAEAIRMAEDLLNEFPGRYRDRWLQMMCAKIGIVQYRQEDRALVDALLQWMEDRKADYTSTFLLLESEDGPVTDLLQDADFAGWHAKWMQRLAEEEGGFLSARDLMQTVNPAYIPRNHLVEEALAAATLGDMAPFDALLKVLSAPYDHRHDYPDYQRSPERFDAMYQTFCGT